MSIIETQQEYYYYSCKHEHGEELLADSLIQDSMRNDDGSDGKGDDSAAASHITTNCLNINHTFTDLPTTPRNGHQPVDKDFPHLTDIGNGASVDRPLLSDGIVLLELSRSQRQLISQRLKVLPHNHPQIKVDNWPPKVINKDAQRKMLNRMIALTSSNLHNP